MGKKKKKKSRFGSPGTAPRSRSAAVAAPSCDARRESIDQLGFLPSAAKGCHVCHDVHNSEWILSQEPLRKSDLGLTESDTVPDISIDPDCGCLSLCNDDTEFAKVFYVSVNRSGRGLNGVLLERGANAGLDHGEMGRPPPMWLTLIVTVPPSTIVDACDLVAEDGDEASGFASVAVQSHVSRAPAPGSAESLCRRRDEPTPMDAPVYLFPLAGTGPFLCTQQFGGQLTHFYAETYHAVDLQCPVGTPVLAIADGVVSEVRDGNHHSGICVENLFHWNSVSLQLDDGNFVDYVHVKSGSMLVKVGERVSRGQPLCASGNVGFCPAPHLHLQVQSRAGDKEPTIAFQLTGQRSDHKPFVPRIGDRFRDLATTQVVR